MLLISIAALALIQCSNDDDTTGDCKVYAVDVSDNCDCDSYSCKSQYWTTPAEYDRLQGILNSSSEPCLYIQAVDRNGNAFEGYLIALNILNYEPCLID